MEDIRINPFFPQTLKGQYNEMQYVGISKREYIATQLLTALISKNTSNSFKFLVGTSLELADELIEKAQNT